MLRHVEFQRDKVRWPHYYDGSMVVRGGGARRCRVGGTRCCGCHPAILRSDGAGGNCSAVPVASGMSARILANVTVTVGTSLTVSGAVGGQVRPNGVTTCWAPRRGCDHVVQLSKVCL